VVSDARQPPGNLRGPPGTSRQSPATSEQPPGTSGDLRGTSEEPPGKLEIELIWRRCCQLDDMRRFRHFWFNSVEKLRKHSNQKKLPTLGCRGCRGLFQAKNANQTKQQNETAPINQSTKQAGNRAISTPQQQLASQYRNQSVGRMARRKKLTTTSTCVNHYHLDDG